LQSVQGDSDKTIICASFSPDVSGLDVSAIAVANLEETINHQNHILNLWNLNLEELLRDSQNYIHDYRRKIDIDVH
jgi:hypothetical protein